MATLSEVWRQEAKSLLEQGTSVLKQIQGISPFRSQLLALASTVEEDDAKTLAKIKAGIDSLLMSLAQQESREANIVVAITALTSARVYDTAATLAELAATDVSLESLQRSQQKRKERTALANKLRLVAAGGSDDEWNQLIAEQLRDLRPGNGESEGGTGGAADAGGRTETEEPAEVAATDGGN